MSGAVHGLRRRLVAAFALFALFSALCFSAFCLLFVYTIEDSFFGRMLEQEAAHQQQAWRASAKLAAPLRSFVTLHRSSATLPPDLARKLDGPLRRGEFSGEQGRHYHLRQVPLDGAAPLYMVAEVSAELVVRPRLPFILTFLGLSTLALLALTIGIGYWLAKRASDPLSRLTALVSAAAPGRLPQRFANQFPDNEIGLLARTLDEAMARIAGFIEREQHFTRDASHELRTPLTVIDGAAQLLAQQPMPAQAAAQLQRIRSACAHMAQTVETLLELAREELGTAPPEPLALLPMLERIVVQHAHMLDGKPVEVIIDVNPEDKVSTHPAALAILLGNLVSNAFAHTQQGQVRIYLDENCLVVDDSGPGIAPALRERLYQPGVKGEGSSGHGLGLSIASRLAVRCGIALEIGSGPAGGGRATLRFPG